MGDNNNVEALENGVGAIGEIVYMHFRSFLKAGFTEDQALCLASTIVEQLTAQMFGGIG